MPTDRSPPVHPTRRLGTTAAAIAEAGALLASGKLVAFPTETVYGLGADATDPAAIARLYQAKGRPHFNPLIAHVASIEAAHATGIFSETAQRLARAFWPGPLTLVVPAAETSAVCELARAGLPSVAIRVPDHPVAVSILRRAGRPIAAPSANRSGHVSPSMAEHVLADLDGTIDAIVDGGAAAIGVESTILACLDDTVTLLRPGGISRERIETLLGRKLDELHVAVDAADAPLAPGRLASHYAPRHALRLDAQNIYPGEGCLAFGLPLPPGADAGLTLNLSETANLAEAATNLYRHLRKIDELPIVAIAATPIPGTGIGEAIRDRLSRAAAPRT